MRKAVAVPYVIALVLGVAVIALLGFWFVTTGGKFSEQATKTQCESKLVVYCTSYIEGKADTKLWDYSCNSFYGLSLQQAPTSEICRKKLGLA